MPAAPAPLDAPKTLGAPEAFGPEDFRSVVAASDAQMADLEAFRVLLADWNTRMNLVGPSALDQFWLRHVLDSAQLLALAPDARRWADIGSGAGFPGLVVAILLKGQDGAHVDLIESQAKKCRFLSAVVQALELPASVHWRRAEDFSLKVDVVTARACAPLTKLLGYAWPLQKRGALGLYLKGQDIGVELEEATRYWSMEVELRPSLSHASGRIVIVRRLKRA
jgi:16S rRNA (guanine527-N7)-methyltransferase